jgi:drug/metabolite transporter superfamily protein YnfA
MSGRWPLLAWLVFLGAALLEVGGDATIRHGLRGGRGLMIATGCVMLAAYGVLVNVVTWDFSRLLGVYVAVFALVSVLFGRFLFQEAVPVSTWLGVGIICVGGAVVQFGSR